MYQGETSTHTLTFSISTSLIKDIKLAYVQDRQIILRKTIKDCTVTDNSIQLKLTQEETLKFLPLEKFKIEIKVLTTDNQVIPFVIYCGPVSEMQNKEVFPI